MLVEIAKALIQQAPRWIIGLVVVAAATAGIYYALAQPQLKYVSEQQANARIKSEMAEYAKHIGELPDVRATLRDDARGLYEVALFPDGCFLQILTRLGTTRSRLSTSFESDPDHLAASLLDEGFSRRVEAATRCDYFSHGNIVRQFQSGQNGCFVFVHRVFADGCEHDQAFDACHGVWADPRWTLCRH